ncbi:MAG: transcription termination factor Rho [Chloroflexi bacterium]|nr:transcription termination factor Rho [Chloroflexota bacterium]MYD47953.1 transcription termination factor Rho [Chloroflexota bacterium]
MVRARTGATAAPRRRRRPPTPGDDSSIAVAPPPTDELSDDAPAYTNGDRSGRQLDVADLVTFSREQLIDLAPEVGLRSDGSLDDLNRDALFHRVRQAASNRNQLTASGVLEVMDAGHGLLRSMQYPPVAGDVFVGQSQIRRSNLKTGDTVTGLVRPPKDGERHYGLTRVTSINLLDPEMQNPAGRRLFESLTPIFPNDHVVLEHSQGGLPCRMIDLFAPIGLGQRGLVVSPPKAGKTTVLRQIAAAVTENHPDVILMVVLIGERPEEVTEMRRAVKGDVFASTFDESVEEQCRVAELAVERAKRMTETGRDVVILLDSITRLTRAYNLALPTSGRTLSGGIDPAALYPAKRFIGAARNLEEGGSLTIIATCLLDTGSRMDEVIYEEFKGTGNMELHLDRRLADQRYFPAIDVVRSGTRREELLYDAETVPQIWLLRRMVTLASGGDQANMGDATKRVLERLARTRTNSEFLTNLTKDS